MWVCMCRRFLYTVAGERKTICWLQVRRRLVGVCACTVLWASPDGFTGFSISVMLVMMKIIVSSQNLDAGVLWPSLLSAEYVFVVAIFSPGNQAHFLLPSSHRCPLDFLGHHQSAHSCWVSGWMAQQPAILCCGA